MNDTFTMLTAHIAWSLALANIR